MGQRLGRGPAGTGLRGLLCFFHPLGQGPLHTSAVMGTSPGWRQEHRWEVSLFRVADEDGVWETISPGLLPAGRETKAGEEKDQGQNLASSSWPSLTQL